MTDIVGAIKTAVEQWNTDVKCGYCWEFTAPMRESDLNEYQKKSDDCCVLVAVTDYRWECLTPVNRSTGLPLLATEIFNFNLHVLIQDRIDINVYNEISGYPEAQSKWDTILKPLADCVVCNPIDFCSVLGYPLEVSRWSANSRIDWLDNNYTGWTINVQLRKNNND